MSPSAVSFVHFRFFDMCRFCIITLTVIQPTPDICVYMDYIYRRFYIWVSWFYRRAMSIAIALHAQGCKTWGFCLQIPLFLLPWWSLRNARVLCFAFLLRRALLDCPFRAVAMFRSLLPRRLSEYIPGLMIVRIYSWFALHGMFGTFSNVCLWRAFTGETIYVGNVENLFPWKPVK